MFDLKSNILIVDDHPINLTVLRAILSDKDYRVRSALSGEQAIVEVQTESPDLILLDINMPTGMDGFEVCTKLKESPKTSDIPVLFISASDETMDKVKAFNVGGVDYIVKPFYENEVLARVETHLSLHMARKQLLEQNQLLSQEIEQRRIIEEEREALIVELQKALQKVKMLGGLLPICCYCKKIRDDEGYWNDLEIYIRDNSEADFSHGICPDCVTEFNPDFHNKTE